MLICRLRLSLSVHIRHVIVHLISTSICSHCRVVAFGLIFCLHELVVFSVSILDSILLWHDGCFIILNPLNSLSGKIFQILNLRFLHRYIKWLLCTLSQILLNVYRCWSLSYWSFSRFIQIKGLRKELRLVFTDSFGCYLWKIVLILWLHMSILNNWTVAFKVDIVSEIGIIWSVLIYTYWWINLGRL